MNARLDEFGLARTKHVQVTTTTTVRGVRIEPCVPTNVHVRRAGAPAILVAWFPDEQDALSVAVEDFSESTGKSTVAVTLPPVGAPEVAVPGADPRVLLTGPGVRGHAFGNRLARRDNTLFVSGPTELYPAAITSVDTDAGVVSHVMPIRPPATDTVAMCVTASSRLWFAMAGQKYGIYHVDGTGKCTLLDADDGIMGGDAHSLIYDPLYGVHGVVVVGRRGARSLPVIDGGDPSKPSGVPDIALPMGARCVSAAGVPGRAGHGLQPALVVACTTDAPTAGKLCTFQHGLDRSVYTLHVSVKLDGAPAQVAASPTRVSVVIGTQISVFALAGLAPLCTIAVGGEVHGLAMTDAVVYAYVTASDGMELRAYPLP